MISQSTISAFGLFATIVVCFVRTVVSYEPADVSQDERARKIHEIDSLNIFIYTLLLILTVLTIWLFMKRRARYIHATGLAVIYGLIVGAIFRYAGSGSSLQTIPMFVNSTNHTTLTEGEKVALGDIASGARDISRKATFDPEIFFNIILPPIIMNAGYSLKRRLFFRNIGAIMTYAFLGTTISCFGVALIMYGLMVFMPSMSFNFDDCVYFGAIISATDPVTVLAIFTDLHVDVNLYALVFGESILNDAVAIVLAGSVDMFATHYQSGKGMDPLTSTGKAISNFVYIFSASLFLGSFVGCVTALLTKFTRLCDFPLLETCLFVLASYSAFLLSEVCGLSGIVTVLFCGMCQAHYTYNNLSNESRARTKQLFELLSFIAEHFIFSYLGVSMFTFPTHRWVLGFIFFAFIAIYIGRAMSIYPLTFVLNLIRNNKIPLNYQHVIFFSGLRGAMAYALAVRNTVSEPRKMMLTATSVITIVQVILFGGLTSTMLQMLDIPIGVEENEQEMLPFSSVKRSNSLSTPPDLGSPSSSGGIVGFGNGGVSLATGCQPAQKSPYEKAWLVRKWYNFDVRYMKPLLTHSRPTLMDTLPMCCLPISRILTTTEQMSNEMGRKGSRSKRVDGNIGGDDGDDYMTDDDYVLTQTDVNIRSRYIKTLANGSRKPHSPLDDEKPSTVNGVHYGPPNIVNNLKIDYIDDKCDSRGATTEGADCIATLSPVPNYKSFTSRDETFTTGVPSDNDNFI